MVTWTDRDKVAVAEIIFYIPALFICGLLASRHGLGRNAGWLFTIFLCLARLIQSAFQLATLNDPTNISLYIGASVLNSVGFSPLLLATIGLLSRVLHDIHRTKKTIVNTTALQLLEIVILAAVAMGVVGGVQAGNKYSQEQHNGEPAQFTLSTLNKAGSGLFIACFVIIISAILITYLHVHDAHHGERRLLYATGAAIPFLIVRLVYSALSAFDSTDPKYNLLEGNTAVYVVMGLVMEYIVLVIYLGVGLTLKKVDKEPEHHAISNEENGGPPHHEEEEEPQPMWKKILSYTILGFLINSFSKSKKKSSQSKGYEMDRQPMAH